MELNPLSAISPVDGRYRKHTGELDLIFSEQGLIAKRIFVEVLWLQKLAKLLNFTIPKSVIDHLFGIVQSQDVQYIKTLERQTNHDVKAVELFVRSYVPNEIKEFVHFGITSEDINNISYGFCMNRGCHILEVKLRKIQIYLSDISKAEYKTPVLSRTHGQPASPTTIGKEFQVFLTRLYPLFQELTTLPVRAKLNGATGTFAALYAAYPDICWEEEAKKFIIELGFEHSHPTTQIEPQDYMVTIFDTFVHINNILVGMCRDIWGYISLGYFKLKVVKEEVGSSTMPHKVNPIDFENAEANLTMANAILRTLSDKLPISRWQRDLTNSSLLRNIGVGFAHSYIAYEAIGRGLQKLEVDKEVLNADLEANWAVLTEAVQTVMRKHHLPDPYTQLKEFSRGKHITKKMLHEFIRTLNIPENDKKRLLELTPATYIGYIK